MLSRKPNTNTTQTVGREITQGVVSPSENFCPPSSVPTRQTVDHPSGRPAIRIAIAIAAPASRTTAWMASAQMTAVMPPTSEYSVTTTPVTTINRRMSHPNSTAIGSAIRYITTPMRAT